MQTGGLPVGAYIAALEGWQLPYSTLRPPGAESKKQEERFRISGGNAQRKEVDKGYPKAGHHPCLGCYSSKGALVS